MEQDTAYQIGYYIGIFFGVFLSGAIVGVVPLLVALRRGHHIFALVSWICCILASFVLGLFLSIPTALVLTVVAVCLKKPAVLNAAGAAQLPGGTVRDQSST